MRTLDLLVSPDRHRGFPPPLRSAPAERKRFRGQARARSGREPSGLQRQVLVVAFAARIIDILPRDSLATLRKRGASMGLPVPGEWSRLCGPRRGWRILDAARGLLRLPHDVVLALSARYDRQDRRPPRAAADRVRSSRRRRLARHPAVLRGLSRSFSVVAQRGSGTVGASRAVTGGPRCMMIGSLEPGICTPDSRGTWRATAQPWARRRTVPSVNAFWQRTPILTATVCSRVPAPAAPPTRGLSSGVYERAR